MPRCLRRLGVLAAGTTVAVVTPLAMASPAHADVVTPDPGLVCETNVQQEYEYGSATCTDVSGAHVWRVHVICGLAPDQYTDRNSTRIGSSVSEGKVCPSYSSGVGGVDIQLQ